MTDERAAIVQYLNSVADQRYMKYPLARAALKANALAIEAGAHLEGEGE